MGEAGERISEMGSGIPLIRLGSKWFSTCDARREGLSGKVNARGELDSEMQAVAYSILMDGVTLTTDGALEVDLCRYP